MMRNVGLLRSQPKCRLHPLIHTLPSKNLAQDIDWCQGGEKKYPHRPIVDKSRWGEPLGEWY